jgi:hypothetical protein
MPNVIVLDTMYINTVNTGIPSTRELQDDDIFC